MCVASAGFVCVMQLSYGRGGGERRAMEDCCELGPGLLFKCKNKNPHWCRDGNLVPPGTGGLTPWR